MDPQPQTIPFLKLAIMLQLSTLGTSDRGTESILCGDGGVLCQGVRGAEGEVWLHCHHVGLKLLVLQPCYEVCTLCSNSLPSMVQPYPTFAYFLV